jgi:hypothetical protein
MFVRVKTGFNKSCEQKWNPVHLINVLLFFEVTEPKRVNAPGLLRKAYFDVFVVNHLQRNFTDDMWACVLHASSICGSYT